MMTPVPLRVPAAVWPAVMAMSPPADVTPFAPIARASASTTVMVAAELVTLAVIVLTLVPRATEFSAETVRLEPMIWPVPLSVMAPLALVSETLPLLALIVPVPLRVPAAF